MVRARSIITGATLIMVLAACSSPKPAESVASLLDADFLIENKNEPYVKLIDMRPRDRYTSGHLSDAIQLWRTDIQDAQNILPGIRASRTHLQDLLRQNGINDGDHIVVYDDKSGVDAARIWWLLKLYGYEKVSLLNGGLQQWTQAGGLISNVLFTPKKEGNIDLKKSNEDYLIEKSDLYEGLQNGSFKIVDVRSDEEYNGLTTKSGALRPGRIPGSISLDYTKTLDANGKFLQRSSLDSLMVAHSVDSEDTIVVYCQSGVRSSHFTFVLRELLDFQNVKNYDGSWIEWSHDLNLPIEIDSLQVVMN